jgi:hypothetical protein
VTATVTALAQRSLVPILGLAIGLGAVAYGLQHWRFGPSGNPLGMQASFSVSTSGDLAVGGDRNFMQGANLVPGGPAATGSFGVQNGLAREALVQIRAKAPSGDVLGLQVAIGSNGKTVAAGTAAGLAAGPATPVRLRPHEARRFGVRVWLPDRVPVAQIEGKAEQIQLEARAIPAAGKAR